MRQWVRLARRPVRAGFLTASAILSHYVGVPSAGQAPRTRAKRMQRIERMKGQQHEFVLGAKLFRRDAHQCSWS